MQEIDDAVARISDVTSKNAAASEEAASAAIQLSSQAAHMHETVAAFRLSGNAPADLELPARAALSSAKGTRASGARLRTAV